MFVREKRGANVNICWRFRHGWEPSVGSQANLALTLEELNRTLVLFCCFPGVERAEVLALACLWICFARIKTVFT